MDHEREAMTQQTLIVVDPDALQSLRDEIASLRRSIESVNMQPKPEWLPVNDYAKYIGKSRKTVMRRIAEGSVETKHIGGVRMVKV